MLALLVTIVIYAAMGAVAQVVLLVYIRREGAAKLTVQTTTDTMLRLAMYTILTGWAGFYVYTMAH